MRQMGATVGMIESGNWILPHNHEQRLARKPQLYSWLTAPVLMATGIYADFTFRWPSVAAALGCTVLVYLLGMRWSGRPTGLLAALLWATSLHMGKLMYLGTTDMLNTFWLMLAILCADRLLSPEDDRPANKRWVLGLWASIILGAMTKGWGVANLPLIAGWIAFTTGLAPGFKETGQAQGLARVFAGLGLIWKRWCAAARRIRLFWGILAFAAVLGPIWGAMFYVGGDEFVKVIETEIWKRTLGGENAPKASSAPTVAWLLFYTLPGSALAIGALTFFRPRKWFARGSQTSRPLWWIVAVALPFSLAHGFRPDYLLPCYVSVAILGAAGVHRLSLLGPGDGKWISTLRHLLAFVAISVCFFVMCTPVLYLYHEYWPEALRRVVRMPSCVAPETWRILAALAPAGLGLIALAVWASLRWRIHGLMAIVIVGMLCVLFIDRHMISRHARTGDGETMIHFADTAGEIVGDDKFAICGADKLGTELYWGRFGQRIYKPSQLKALDPDIRWLITCDRGLVQLGACLPDSSGSYMRKIEGKNTQVSPHPRSAGFLMDLNINRPISEDNMGRIYLIRLQR